MEGNNRVSKIWSDIIRAVISKPVIHNLYLVNTAIQLGNGQRAQLWLDKWVGEMCLKEEFSRLFSLSTDKNGILVEFYTRWEGTQGWNLGFRRPLLAWEEEEVSRLQAATRDSPALRDLSLDIWKWKADLFGVFSVACVQMLRIILGAS